MEKSNCNHLYSFEITNVTDSQYYLQIHNGIVHKETVVECRYSVTPNTNNWEFYVF